MPIYEYECISCHLCFERRQGFHEEPVAICPRCQGKAQRVLHAVPVIFRGSGFYVTDNRKGSPVEDSAEKKPEAGKKSEAKKAESTSAQKK